MIDRDEIAAVALNIARRCAKRFHVPLKSILGATYIEVARCAENLKPNVSLENYAARCVPFRLMDEYASDTGYRKSKGDPRESMLAMMGRHGKLAEPTYRAEVSTVPEMDLFRKVKGRFAHDVADLLARGLTQAHVARSIGIAKPTVWSCVSRMRAVARLAGYRRERFHRSGTTRRVRWRRRRV